ncbi:MAG: hypothetical protein U1E36_01625 [Rickettsiales bacterium]
MTQSWMWRNFPIVVAVATAFTVAQKNNDKKQLDKILEIAEKGLLSIEQETSSFGNDSIFTLKEKSGHPLCRIRLPASIVKDIKIRTGLELKENLTNADIGLIEDVCKTVILERQSQIHVENTDNLFGYLNSLEKETPYTHIVKTEGHLDITSLEAEIADKIART